jgi:sec-independent protein translocase protein TatA
MVGGGHLWELVVMLVLALIFFGPKRLPEVGSGLGQTLRAFQKATHEDAEGSPDETMPSLPAAPQHSAISDDTAVHIGGAPIHGERVPWA